jgi:hypothetical protein
LTALDVDVAWCAFYWRDYFLWADKFCIRYVPNPSPNVFRTTKNNHNILQGVARPDLRLTQAAKDQFDAWIQKNGLRWTAEGGPLAPGGVDIAFIGQFSSPRNLLNLIW